MRRASAPGAPRRAAWLVPPLLLLGLAVAASLLTLNVTRWGINATPPPVHEVANGLLYPLLQWQHFPVDGVNYTLYVARFKPGWVEQYTIGALVARDAGWQGRLAAVARSQAADATYLISLGDAAQVNQGGQDAGPPTSLSAPLRLTAVAQGRFSVLARAIYSRGGISAWQWLNITAVPMSRLRGWSFTCGQSSPMENFNYRQLQLTDGFNYKGLPTDCIQAYYVGAPNTGVYIASVSPTSPPSLATQVDACNGADLWNCRGIRWGYAMAIYNLTGCGYRIPADGATIRIWARYVRFQNSSDRRDWDQQNNVAYVSIGVDTDGDGRVDVEHIYFMADLEGGYNVTLVSSFIDRGAEICRTSNPAAGCASSTRYRPVYLGPMSSGNSYLWNIDLAGLQGHIVGIALGAVDDSGRHSGGEKGDFWIYWDDLLVRWGALPPHIQAFASGSPNTGVYVSASEGPSSSPPSLATQADGGPAGYGYAIAVVDVERWLGQAVPAAGTSISVWGKYGYMPSAEAADDVAFVAVGVDTDGDGVADVEYIYYRLRLEGANRAYLVSSILNPGHVVCIIAAPANTCSPADPRYRVAYLGGLTAGGVYRWDISLGDAPGAVVRVALGVVDGGPGADGDLDDVWTYWDDLALRYAACPPPPGWRYSGYVWQCNGYLLVTAGGAASVDVAPGELTYIADLAGAGRYLAYSLPNFGIQLRGSTSGCIYGLNPPPDAARYVELRPLAGYGEVIVRDWAGGILYRQGCPLQQQATAVGFATGPGELLKIYSLEAWG